MGFNSGFKGLKGLTMNLQHFSVADARLRCVHPCALLQRNTHLIVIKIPCLETYIYYGEINKILIDLSFCVCYFSFFPYFTIDIEFPAFLSIFFSEFFPLSCFCASSPSLCLYFRTSHISCILISIKPFCLSSSHSLFLSLCWHSYLFSL